MISDVIRQRRSVFPVQFNDRTIDRATIERILEAANWAPTHKKTEPWRFKVLMGKKKDELGQFLSDTYQAVDLRPKQIKIKKLQENAQRSAVVIAICMQRDPLESLPEWEEIAATAMAVQNMWLCCTELGIGTYWSSPALITHMDGFFEMNEGERCLGFLYMGRYDEPLPQGERRPIAEKVAWL